MNKFLSVQTLYYFFVVKLTAWTIGLWLGMQVFSNSPVQELDYEVLLFTITAILGLVNFKLKNYYVYTLVCLGLMFSWTYALFEFGFDNISFARTIPETVLVYWVAANIQVNRKNPLGPLA